MKKSAIERDLIALGIDPTDYRVLKLLPLVYVAWADGNMEAVERERIMNLARSQFPIGESGMRLLKMWLYVAPSRRYIQQGLRDLLALARAPDGLDINVEELPMLLAYAESIARSTALGLDAPWSVTPAEEAALSEIAALLRIDNGTSWASLLRELDTARLPEPHVDASGSWSWGV
ncbi:MAG TPA: hypothetical protein VI072_34720 [Polyangiaceae bacterium]